ncbi:MAG TPA: uroporphyrinogen-III synthase [Candidatus Acidoferrum sp.]|nr:uroporphyrinogen-III synthase [Candidatus Acidoferrum sp.]
MAESSANALLGKRVVITRAAEQCQSLLATLRERGAQPILLPMVAFAPPDDLLALDDSLFRMREYHWVFFTSQNAVRALQERSEHLKLSLRDAVATAQIAAVGPATAEAARAAGLSIAYVAKEQHGVALAQELQAEIRGKRVLLPRSDRANHDLVETLQRLGAHVSEIVAYKTLRPASDDTRYLENILQDVPDAVLFFSPSAVHHLRELLGPQSFQNLAAKSVFAAIGTVTERALRGAGVQRLIVASDTSASAILESLADFFVHSGHSLPAGAKHQ